jgi:hypothetical protein
MRLDEFNQGLTRHEVRTSWNSALVEKLRPYSYEF